MKKIISMLLLTCLTSNFLSLYVTAEESLEISAPSAFLMEYETGNVLYEKNPDEKRALASVTKIMTLLLTMEEIYSGNLKYDDIVTGSEYAKSFGGSTIFLDAGEKMTVQDIIKGITVASGNDASVAIAEHICGSESVFVSRMNEKAQKLGMTGTNFVNCNGLDAEGHYSTARDIATMSRELMKYEDIFRFTNIWMDSLRNGEFTLSNTNKLIRFYDGATGLKTGSTNNAKFCISATAKRNGMHLIAVIMGAETSKSRQADASTLLDFGFDNFSSESIIDKTQKYDDIQVSKGLKTKADIYPSESIVYLSKKNDNVKVDVISEMAEKNKAPVSKGDIAGTLKVMINNKEYKKINLLYGESVDKISLAHLGNKYIKNWIC